MNETYCAQCRRWLPVQRVDAVKVVVLPTGQRVTRALCARCAWKQRRVTRHG